MSENFDVLLEDDEDCGDGEYDLQDDEENALLDEGDETPSQQNDAVEIDEAEDVLQLDETVEIADEYETKHESADITNDESDEEERRNDKFTNERDMTTKTFVASGPVIPKSNNGKAKKLFNKNLQNQRGTYQNRGRGRGGRGNYSNSEHLRVAPFQQENTLDSKKVLINPHFRGNVHVRTDTRLAWDNQQQNRMPPFGNQQAFIHQNQEQTNNKPTMYIQPWTQQPPSGSQYHQTNEPPPTVNNNTYNIGYQNSTSDVPLMHVNPQRTIPVHQRLGNQDQSNINASQFNQNRQVYMRYLQAPPLPVFPNQTPVHEPPPFQDHFGGFPAYSNHQPLFHGVNPMPGAPQQYSVPPPQVFHQSAQPSFHNQQSYNEYVGSQGQDTYLQHLQVPHQYPLPPPPYEHHQQQHHHHQVSNTASMSIPHVLPSRQDSTYTRQERNWGQNSPTKRRFDVGNADLRKKKRPLATSNLHQVPTVADSKVQQIDEVQQPEIEEDEETKSYRKKIEEQKRIRERILRQKEERRKQAAKKLQAEQEYATVAAPMEILLKPDVQMLLPAAVKAEEKLPVMLKSQQQSDATAAAASADVDQLGKEHISSFLSNRTIIAKDDSLIDTSIVVVNNLAAGTSEIKLRKLCQGVGDIQKLQLSAKERQATIQFKSVASAHAFFKKYQRYMLDLSMIQVALKSNA